MYAQAYVGYLDKGLFYTSGQRLQLPERRKLVITVLDEVITDPLSTIVNQPSRPAWLDELNRLLDESSDDELDAEVFCRTSLRQEPIFFTEGELLA